MLVPLLALIVAIIFTVSYLVSQARHKDKGNRPVDE